MKQTDRMRRAMAAQLTIPTPCTERVILTDLARACDDRVAAFFIGGPGTDSQLLSRNVAAPAAVR